MNRDATTIGRCLNPAAGAKDPNVWVFPLNEDPHDDKHADISENQASKTFMRTESLVVTLSREKLKFLVQVKVKSAVEVAQGEEWRSVSLKLIEEITGDVFAAG